MKRHFGDRGEVQVILLLRTDGNTVFICCVDSVTE